MRTANHDRCGAHDEERRGVDEHRDLQAPGTRDHTSDQRADCEPGVAGGLHPRIRDPDPRLPGDARNERELGRLPDGESDAEKCCEQEDDGGATGEGQNGGDNRLCDGGHQQHAPRVVAVREQACRSRKHDGRRPEGEIQQGERDPGTGGLLQEERQRHEREPVPERGQSHGPDEDVEVAAHGYQRTCGGAGAPCPSCHETTGFRSTPIRSISHSITSPGLR